MRHRIPLPPYCLAEHCAVWRVHHVQGLWSTPAEGPEEDSGRPSEDERRTERWQTEGQPKDSRITSVLETKWDLFAAAAPGGCGALCIMSSRKCVVTREVMSRGHLPSCIVV